MTPTTVSDTQVSQLPWYASAVQTSDDGWVFATIGPFQLSRGDIDHLEETICEVSGINHDAGANAAYIVKACNLYPELLAALKGVMHDIDTGFLVRNIDRDGQASWASDMFAFVQRLQRAQAAIAKAEGQ